jgi:hypothetical protein
VARINQIAAYTPTSSGGSGPEKEPRLVVRSCQTAAVAVWDTATGTPIDVLSAGSGKAGWPLETFALADGRPRIMVHQGGEGVRIWDGEALSTCPPLSLGGVSEGQPPSAKVTGFAAFHEPVEGRACLVTSHEGGGLSVWEGATGALIRGFDPDGGNGQRPIFSGPGKLLCYTPAGDDSTSSSSSPYPRLVIVEGRRLSVRDLETGEVLAAMEGTHTIECLACFESTWDDPPRPYIVTGAHVRDWMGSAKTVGSR